MGHSGDGFLATDRKECKSNPRLRSTSYCVPHGAWLGGVGPRSRVRLAGSKSLVWAMCPVQEGRQRTPVERVTVSVVGSRALGALGTLSAASKRH
jgi:hypothetical protein